MLLRKTLFISDFLILKLLKTFKTSTISEIRYNRHINLLMSLLEHKTVEDAASFRFLAGFLAVHTGFIRHSGAYIRRKKGSSIDLCLLAMRD